MYEQESIYLSGNQYVIKLFFFIIIVFFSSLKLTAVKPAAVQKNTVKPAAIEIKVHRVLQ